MQEEKKVGKFELLQPLMYCNRMSCSFNVYELHMLRNSLDVDQRELQKLIDNCTADIQKYDLLELKLKRAELSERVNDMILAVIGPVKD